MSTFPFTIRRQLLLAFLLFSLKPFAFAQDTSSGIIWYPPIQLSDSSYWSNLAHIAISGDDTIHVTWSSGSRNRVPYARSVNGGVSFEPTRDLLTDTVTYPHEPFHDWVVADNNNVYLFFVTSDPPDPYGSPIHMIKSTDGGTTFANVQNIYPDTVGIISWVTILGDTIVIFYPPNSPYRLLRSTNAGQTWTRTSYALDTEDISRFALTPGKLHQVFYNFANNTVEVRYRYSLNVGTTWKGDTILSTQDGFYSDLPNILGYQTKCGTELMVAWRDVKYGVIGFAGASIISKISLDDGKTWAPEVVHTSQPDGSYPRMSFNGNVRSITWSKEESPFETLHVAMQASNNSLFDLGPDVDITPGTFVGSKPFIVASSHAVHVVWEALVGTTFRIFYRRGEFIQKNVDFSFSQGFFTFDTTTVDFPSVDTLYITNPGTDTLTVGTAYSPDSNFTVYPILAKIPPGSVFPFVISFDPKTAGSKSGKIHFYHEGPTSPDCITVTGIAKWRQFEVSTRAGEWNMLSIPLDPGYNQSLPSLFEFGTTYMSSSAFESGKGYWAKPIDSIITFEGKGISSKQVAIRQGWNLIGSITNPVPINQITTIPDSIITSEFLWFNGEGYVAEDTIQPGKSYWVKASQTGNIIIGQTTISSSIVREINRATYTQRRKQGELKTNQYFLPKR